jgi:septum formation protein
MLILASQSPTRRRMLSAAGVPHKAVSPTVNEEKAKVKLRAEGFSGSDLALALAIAKALSVSAKRPESLILGADQTLECDDGSLIDKAADQAALVRQLGKLSGMSHKLHAAAVLARGGEVVWKTVETVTMTMRPLSKAFIADYVTGEGDGLLGCVGGYRIEGRGAQLFSQIEGSHFAILGLPLLPLLDRLRKEGLMPS